MSGLYNDKEDRAVSEETKLEKELDGTAWREADTQHDSHRNTGCNSNRNTKKAVTHSV